MKNEEFILRVSEIVPDRPGDTSRELICGECERPFFINNMGSWAYKTIIDGRTVWFCRYNCHRAGEKRHDAKIAENRSRAGRKQELKSKKPSKEVLECNLRAGLPIAAIAKMHEGSVQSVHNWIKAYGLAGIQGQKKPISEKQTSAGDAFDIVADQVRRAKEIITKPILEEMVQGSPTLAAIEIAKDEKFYDDLKTGYAEMVQESPTLTEIEQFHTDIEVYALPEEIVPAPTGIDLAMVESFFADTAPSELLKIEPELRETTEKTKPDLLDYEFKELMERQGDTQSNDEADVRDHDAPRETFDEIWQDVHDDLVTLKRLYIAQAEKSFGDRLREMLAYMAG